MSYVTVAELGRVLNLPAPTPDQQAAMQRVIDAAAAEIDWELPEYAAEAAEPYHPLVVEVNLERAREHWQQALSLGFGVLPVGGDVGSVLTARDSWQRHHLKLRPLKVGQGIA